MPLTEKLSKITSLALQLPSVMIVLHGWAEGMAVHIYETGHHDTALPDKVYSLYPFNPTMAEDIDECIAHVERLYAEQYQKEEAADVA